MQSIILWVVAERQLVAEQEKEKKVELPFIRGCNGSSNDESGSLCNVMYICVKYKAEYTYVHMSYLLTLFIRHLIGGLTKPS